MSQSVPPHTAGSPSPASPLTAAAAVPGDNAAEPEPEHHSGEPSQQLPPPSPPPPKFEPLFTLLTNATSNTTVHPRVHYLFSDDDTSVLTNPPTDPSHRALIVDLAAPTEATGTWSVSWASSLSPDFAVTDSHISLQQAGDSGSGNDGAANSSVMLHVEGVEREPVEMRPDSLPSSGSGPVGREDADTLAEEFRRRLGVLKRVVGEGEKRREVVNRHGDEEQLPGSEMANNELEQRDNAEDHD